MTRFSIRWAPTRPRCRTAGRVQADDPRAVSPAGGRYRSSEPSPWQERLTRLEDELRQHRSRPPTKQFDRVVAALMALVYVVMIGREWLIGRHASILGEIVCFFIYGGAAAFLLSGPPSLRKDFDARTARLEKQLREAKSESGPTAPVLTDSPRPSQAHGSTFTTGDQPSSSP